MLERLRLQNFALFVDQSVEFDNGFNSLLGETGAGKSIIIDALSFVIGAKSDKIVIRYGENSTKVEAVFSELSQNAKNLLDEAGIEFDDSIIVKFDEIKDNGINVLICSYTDSVDYPSYLAEREDINYKIMKILKEEGISLAYNTQTVYVKN